MTLCHFDFCLGTANPALRKAVVSMLADAGFYASGEAKDIPALLRKLRTLQPWLAVVDTALPPGNVKQLAAIIENDGLAAALYINTTGKTLDNYVQLKWPVETPVLSAVAEAVCNEFAHKKKLQKEIETLQKKLQERKLIEKAKGILMKFHGLDEEEAFELIRKKSMAARISNAETAAGIIERSGSNRS